jgi:hypothetical protein
MLLLLLAALTFATEPEPVEAPPICEAGVVVIRVSPASVDRSQLEPVDTRGVRRSAVTAVSAPSDEASRRVERPPVRVAAR